MSGASACHLTASSRYSIISLKSDSKCVRACFRCFVPAAYVRTHSWNSIETASERSATSSLGFQALQTRARSLSFSLARARAQVEHGGVHTLLRAFVRNGNGRLQLLQSLAFPSAAAPAGVHNRRSINCDLRRNVDANRLRTRNGDCASSPQVFRSTPVAPSSFGDGA